MEIVTLGELILDMFASESGKDFFSVTAFLPVAGGAPANVAVAAARLGVKSAFIGKVGEDQFGHRLEKVLKEYGVDTTGMRYDARYRTTLNFMTVPDPHRTEMLFYRNPGADMLLEPGELDWRSSSARPSTISAPSAWPWSPAAAPPSRGRYAPEKQGPSSPST